VLRHVTAPDGVRIGCEVAGDGPPLVLVHGAGSARWSFDLVRPYLEERFTVWSVDRRGRGDSDDGNPYGIEREFDDVVATVSEAGPDAVLFGHSYGALVSAGAACRLDGLRGLVLYEPPMGGVLADEDWTRRFEANVEAGERDVAVRVFMHDVGGYSHEEIDAMVDTPVWQGRIEVAHTVPRELRAEDAYAIDRLSLGDLAPPCLMLLGSESPPWAQRSTEAFSSAIHAAEVHSLEGHGHGALTSGPELLASEIVGLAG